MKFKNKRQAYLINAIAAILSFIFFQSLISLGLVNNYHKGIMILVCINAIMTVSLNLATGLLGELTLGHAGFMAIGAYTTGLISKGLIAYGIPAVYSQIFCLIIAGIFSSIVAYLIGIPALRLRGDYLAIITLSFGEIISILLRSFNFTGGARGLSGIPRITNFTSAYWTLILTIYIIYALIRSRQGRAIIAIREDDIAASASGINTTRYKAMAFSISAFFAGVGGGLFAQFQGILAPEKFNYTYSIDFMVMVVFGGMGSITGSVLSAIFLTFLPELLRGFSDQVASMRFLIYAILLILLMIFRPSGLLGQKELSQKVIKNIFYSFKKGYLSDPYLTEQGPGNSPIGGSSVIPQENIPLPGTPESLADTELAERARMQAPHTVEAITRKKGER